MCCYLYINHYHVSNSYSALQLSNVTLKKRFVKDIVSTSNATQGEEEEASIAKYPNENVKDVDLLVNTGSILKQTVRIKQEDGHLQVSLPDISEVTISTANSNAILLTIFYLIHPSSHAYILQTKAIGNVIAGILEICHQ